MEAPEELLQLQLPLLQVQAQAQQSATRPAPAFVKLAAGCTSIGAHSMGIAHDGALFGWGSAYAAGSGSLKAVLRPRRVRMPLLPPPQNQNQPQPNENSDAAAAGGAAEEGVVDVACGGGFSVCVTDSGAVYSWGMWAHGRLGARRRCLICLPAALAASADCSFD